MRREDKMSKKKGYFETLDQKIFNLKKRNTNLRKENLRLKEESSKLVDQILFLRRKLRETSEETDAQKDSSYEESVKKPWYRKLF